MTQRLHESLSKVQVRESLIFQTTFSIDFPNTYNDYYCSPMLLIHFFVVLVKEGDFSLPVPTSFSPLLFMFLNSILFLTKKL